MKKPALVILDLVLFTVFTAVLFKNSVLCTDLHKLYSKSLAHRLQTQALLQGHLSLAPLPFGAQIDFNWSGHGLQQVWGLGVPLLRLPFEGLANIGGFGPFPDRLVLLFYLFLVIYILHFAMQSLQKSLGGEGGAAELCIRWYVMAWIFLSPAMGILLHRQINNVYHETIFYGCLYAYVLLALLWVYISGRDARVYIGLSLAAGLGCLIRPTLLAYGLASMMAASIVVMVQQRPIKLVMAGILSFGLGLGFTAWTNVLRFGSPLDFGQGANFTGIPILIYSLRFDYPFHHEPILSAAKELFGALFLQNPWESPTARFRWGFGGYRPPFNFIHVLVLLSGLGVFYAACKTKAQNILMTTVPWALMSFALLFVFYAHTLYIQSRYLSEFAPAVSAVGAVLILTAGHAFRVKRHLKGGVWIFWLVLVLVFYFGNKDFFMPDHPAIQRDDQLTDKKGIDHLMTQFRQGLSARPQLPVKVYCGSTNLVPGLFFRAYPFQGMVFQYNGWDIQTDCFVRAATSFILPNKKCLTLNATATPQYQGPTVRVKRDNDELVFDHADGPARQIKTFCQEKTSPYPEAYYTIGWVMPEALNAVKNDLLPVRLSWVKVSDTKK